MFPDRCSLDNERIDYWKRIEIQKGILEKQGESGKIKGEKELPVNTAAAE